jgi:hypothetical protein
VTGGTRPVPVGTTFVPGAIGIFAHVFKEFPGGSKEFLPGFEGKTPEKEQKTGAGALKPGTAALKPGELEPNLRGIKEKP